jgi:hypothetical protein
MPALTITKTYVNGNVLTQTDLDNAFNSISTLLNTTLLDYLNVQTGGLLGTNLANGTIGNAQLGLGSVGTAQIASSAVISSNLASNITIQNLNTPAFSVGSTGQATGLFTLFSGVGASSAGLYSSAGGALVTQSGLYPSSSANALIQAGGANFLNVVSSSGANAGRPVVVSAIPSNAGLMIVRGAAAVDGSTASIAFGEGFTVSRSGSAQVLITFTNAFFDSPAVTATPAKLDGGIKNNSLTVSSTPTTVTVDSVNAATGSAQNTQFHFIAIGQRGV